MSERGTEIRMLETAGLVSKGNHWTSDKPQLVEEMIVSVWLGLVLMSKPKAPPLRAGLAQRS